MRTHLDLTVTTIATIWRIIRIDGVNFYFTDHDQNMTFDDGDGPQVYVADSGYSRTAVANNVGLSVDNMDMEGVFDNDAIKEDELRAGLFDHAEIRVSVINWSDLSQGAIRMRRGRIGEVLTTPQGVFRTELRGLTQQLSQNIVKSYQAECRVDLGSVECTIPIKPTVLGRNQAVTVGDVYRVATSVAPGINIPNVMENASFELGTPAEPVSDLPNWTIVNGTWRLTNTFEGLAADDGVLYLQGGDSVSGELLQTIALETLGLNIAQVQAGNVEASFSIRRANNAASDEGRVLVQFLDSLKAPVGTLLDTGSEAISPDDVWATRSATSVAVPTSTTQVRVQLFHARVAGAQSNATFDTVSLTFDDLTGIPTTQDIYENLIYRVTTAGITDVAQPVYDTIIGNTTTDGTAVLTAEDSFTRDAFITSVVDRLNLSIAVTEPRAIDGWYNGGAFIVEEGPNAGVVREIKEWTQIGGVMSIFMTEPFNLVPSIKVRVYPGCDKRRETCRDRFLNIINFQGEPDVPGQDAITAIPDAN